MANEEITIDIPLDGSIVVEGHGFVGPECKLAMVELEKALGKVEKVVNKPEFYRTRTVAKTSSR